jgi:hypothetical protein
MTIAAARRRSDTQVPAVGAFRTTRHLYYFNGEGPWPGVTTVTDVLDKPALVKWMKEQVALAALKHADRLVTDREAGNQEAAVAFLLAARNEGTNGRDRGTRIHDALQSILLRQPVAIADQDRPAIEGARSWLNENGVRPLEVESFLLNPTMGYGGTCDLIAEIAGEVWLLDWKSSKSVADAKGKVWREMRLQLAGYSRSEFIARPADPNRYPIPPIQRLGIVHVTDAGTRLYPVDIDEQDWIAFRACLYLHRWAA